MKDAYQWLSSLVHFYNKIRQEFATKSDISTTLLDSPTFTGTPKAPTAVAGTNTTQIATTSFVTTAIDNIARVENGNLIINSKAS